MSLYKAVLKIFKSEQNKFVDCSHCNCDHHLLLCAKYSSTGCKIGSGTMTIVTEDNSALSKALIDYLKEEQTVVELSDKSQKSIDDALYFGKSTMFYFCLKILLRILKQVYRQQSMHNLVPMLLLKH